MKIKSLLIGMLACTALVGCTNDDEPVVNNGNENSGKAYLAVKLVNPSVNSRATGDYADGTNAEQAVTKARFYLFKANGEPYDINDESTNTTNPAKNYVDATSLEEITENPASDNVETVFKAVLVIDRSKSAPPASILAVLNYDESKLVNDARSANLSLADLQALSDNFGTKKGSSAAEKPYTESGTFVMSNSVYVDATGKVAIATPIAAENICDTKGGTTEDNDGALDNPVVIYVERAAAKVETMITSTSTTVVTDGTIFKIGNDYYAATGVNDANNRPVYAHLKGWRVTNITEKTNLIKSLTNSYTFTTPWTWNNASDYRSYWANTTESPVWKWNFNDANLAFNSCEYYNENTKNGDVLLKHGSQLNSQLLVAAEFVTLTNGTPNAAEPIAEWYGVKFTLDGLKDAIVTSLASKLYKDNKGATSIAATDISFEQVSDNISTTPEGRYISRIKIASGTYYKSSGTAYTADELAALESSLQRVKIWGGKDASDNYVGGGYYYVNIEHNATTGVYGLVRNHWYQLTLTKLRGLGTPVYDPTKVIITEKPETDESFIAAQINVLAWRMVNQDVTLE